MVRFLLLIIRHSFVFILIIIGVTIFLGIKAASISIDPDFYSIYPKDTPRVKTLEAETGIIDSPEMHLYLAVEAEDKMTAEKIRLFAGVVDLIKADPRVESCISPFNFITFRNDRGRLSIEPLAPSLPSNNAEADEFIQRLISEPLAQGFVTAKEGRVLSALFVNTRDADAVEFTQDFEDIIKPLRAEFRVMYSGDLPLVSKTSSYISRDLFLLLALAGIVILIVLFLSFRAVRAVILPIITVVFGVIWSLGFSAILGYKLSVVSIALPTIVLAVGSSYTVHILSEYFRGFGSSGEHNDTDLEISNAVSHVMKTIIMAGVTTIIGFSSLLLTSIGPLREFGVSISLGILSCIILSLFFLPALLSKLSPPHINKKKDIAAGYVNRITIILSGFVVRHFRILIIAFGAVILLAVFLYPEISRKVDYIDYFPSEDQITSDSYEIIENSGGSQTLNITFKAPDGASGYFLRPEVIKRFISMQKQIIDNEDVLSLMSFYSLLEQINEVMFYKDEPPENKGLIMLLSRYVKLIMENDVTYASDTALVNDDYTQMTIFLRVYDSTTGKYIADKDIIKLVEQLEDVVDEYISTDEGVYYWGNSLLFYEVGNKIQKDQLFATIVAMLLIVIVSMVFFKSFLLSILTLIPLIFAISLNYILMVLLNIPLDVTTVLVANVAIGVGVDDAIHFILQYRAILKKTDRDSHEAVKNSLQITGRPIILTTVSIVAGVIILVFASFKPIVYFGLLVSISLAAAMVSTLFILPAFLVAFRRSFFIYLK